MFNTYEIIKTVMKVFTIMARNWKKIDKMYLYVPIFKSNFTSAIVFVFKW